MKPATTKITRDEAATIGRARYFTGLPCKRGHVAERYTVNSACVECQNRKLPRRAGASHAYNLITPPSPLPVPHGFPICPEAVSYAWGRIITGENGRASIWSQLLEEWRAHHDAARAREEETRNLPVPEGHERLAHVPPHGHVMLAPAQGISYELFRKQGWTDAQLIEHGYMKINTPTE